MAKLSEFLAKNNISYYKMSQLIGKDPMLFTGFVKAKLTGQSFITFEELELYCKKLSEFLHKEIDPKSFEVKVEKIKMG